jgi:hypothetical protein
MLSLTLQYLDQTRASGCTRPTVYELAGGNQSQARTLGALGVPFARRGQGAG